MTRPHPYDTIFAEVAEAAFVRIREQGSVETIADFVRLPAASAFLEQVAPPDPTPPDPSVIGGFAHLAYTLYRFWLDGRVTRVVARTNVDVEVQSSPAKTPAVAAACYLQFPERWFWARIDDEAPHEPLDGIFVAPAGDEVALTAILGFRSERFGFSQLTALADAAAFEAAAGLRREPLFGPVMDGGAAADVRSLVSEAELVYLTQLALGWGPE